MSPVGGFEEGSGSVVDSDTGEMITPFAQDSKPTLFYGDSETGEETQLRLVYQRSKFRVPRSALKVATIDTALLDSPKKETDASCDFSLLILPLLIILPGWATVIYIMAEVLYHNWVHAQRGCVPFAKTPMRRMFDATCAECVAKKRMQKVGKLQDERTLRIISRRILNYNCSQFGIGT